MKVPYPRCPHVPNFELLVAEASALPQIVHLDDQRLFDAGLAAEYFLQVQTSYAVPPVDRAPTSAPAPSNVHPVTHSSNASLGLSTLPLSRQNHVILHTMLSLMSQELRVEYELFATPADILNDISTWESDYLNSEAPALLEELQTATMANTERVDEFFWRVRGYCKDLRKANTPVDQNYAMGVIVNGIRLGRFDTLRQRYGMMKLNGEVPEYWGVLKAYHDLDRINMELPKTDSRHPGWSRAPSHSPANAAFQHKQRQGNGSKEPVTSKRAFESCTWRPCPNQRSHSEDRCWTKHPELRDTKLKFVCS